MKKMNNKFLYLASAMCILGCEENDNNGDGNKTGEEQGGKSNRRQNQSVQQNIKEVSKLFEDLKKGLVDPSKFFDGLKKLPNDKKRGFLEKSLSVLKSIQDIICYVNAGGEINQEGILNILNIDFSNLNWVNDVFGNLKDNEAACLKNILNVIWGKEGKDWENNEGSFKLGIGDKSGTFVVKIFAFENNVISLGRVVSVLALLNRVGLIARKDLGFKLFPPEDENEGVPRFICGQLGINNPIMLKLTEEELPNFRKVLDLSGHVISFDGENVSVKIWGDSWGNLEKECSFKFLGEFSGKGAVLPYVSKWDNKLVFFSEKGKFFINGKEISNFFNEQFFGNFQKNVLRIVEWANLGVLKINSTFVLSVSEDKNNKCEDVNEYSSEEKKMKNNGYPYVLRSKKEYLTIYLEGKDCFYMHISPDGTVDNNSVDVLQRILNTGMVVLKDDPKNKISSNAKISVKNVRNDFNNKEIPSGDTVDKKVVFEVSLGDKKILLNMVYTFYKKNPEENKNDSK